MSNITGMTRGGAVWEPQFVVALNQATCIGCGRCYKVCPRNVFELVDRADLDLEEIEMEDEDDDNMMVMTIANALDCIGCQACSKVCPKKCHSHEAQSLAA
ncbi:ferredoxin III, nif-specific [Thioflexithrix psekupsensis]|uniref:Ferredoxin III n=1 Tax=Thioflexithrix psekupsensis TaxID=1570016 RepID=A0A251X5J7_9GAMM|nr:ferredoxin III, nif-specific [Thioflexithrix psekupsensis]OUD12625.1 ferredoxin III, nif-specific [Thioflexithrix psekupsensis]